MRLQLRNIKACEVPVDTFLWIPSKKAFIFIDDKDEDEDNVTFYFELGVNGKGIEEVTKSYKKSSIVQIVEQYKITPKMIDDDVKEYRQELIDSKK